MVAQVNVLATFVAPALTIARNMRKMKRIAVLIVMSARVLLVLAGNAGKIARNIVIPISCMIGE